MSFRKLRLSFLSLCLSIITFITPVYTLLTLALSVILLGCTGCQQLQEELVSSKSEVLQLSSTLTTQKENTTLLQHQLKEMEAKYTEDLNSREEALRKLNADLETKSNTVALITQQYHQLSLRFHQELEASTLVNTCTCHKHHVCNPVIVNEENTVDTELEVLHSHQQYRGLRLPNPPLGISRRTPTTIQRRRFHRTTSSPVPCEASSMSSLENSTPNIISSSADRRLPTPPMSPRPLSSSSSPPHLRRASRPVRRQTPSLGSAVSVRNIDNTSVTSSNPPPSRSHVKLRSNHNQSYDRSTSSMPLDPVRRQKHRALPPDVIQSREKDVQILPKPSPPILPPIVAGACMSNSDYSNTPQSQVESVSLMSSTSSLSNSSYQSTPPSHRRQHRHFILSRAQGLSSAPVRTMKVLCYGQTGLDRHDNEDITEEDSKGGLEAADGMLLVKETVSCEDQKWQELHQQGTD